MALEGAIRAGRLAGSALAALGLLASAAEAAAPPGQWWDATYRYRQKITVTNGPTAILAGYSVRFQFDHASLVSVSQSLASGDDARIAWWNGTAWVELDRLLDDQSAWNGATTRVWFRTQAALGSGASDDNYYLYYGHSAAGAPPANGQNVFLLYDNFNDGAFDAALWACADPFNLSPPAACTESGGTMTLDSDSQLATTFGNSAPTNTRWDARVRLATATAPSGAYNQWGASNQVNGTGGGDPYTDDWVTFWADSQHWLETGDAGTSTSLGPWAPSTPTSFHVYTFDREGATNVRFFQDGVQVGNKVSDIPNAFLRILVFNDTSVANGTVLDWVRVRRFVASEPTAAFAAAEIGPSPMRVISGTYVGNGAAAGRAIQVGFQPDLVILTTDNTNANVGTGFPSGHTAVLRTSSMVGNVSKAAYFYNYHPLANRITSLDAMGFTVGHPPDHAATNDDPGDPYHCANHAGVRYYWTAFRAAAGQMAVGSYSGDGAANKDITSVGFRPDYTIVMANSAREPVERYALMPADWSRDFDGGSQCPAGCTRTPAIRTELPNGFRVGPYMNANGVVHHYVAWKSTPGRIAVGSYTGTGDDSNCGTGACGDNRAFTGLGFFPEFVTAANGQNPVPGSSTVFKPASTGVAVDYTPMYIAYASGWQGPDWIQALQADGFQVGSAEDVNENGQPQYYAAFGPHTPATNYRSIGNTAVTYGTAGTSGAGTRVSVTNGSATVSGLLGTTWAGANRGRGDVITIPCDNPPACTLPSAGVHYQVLAVASNGSLQLSREYQGSSNPSASYVIRRQFGTLAAWEGCIDGQGGTPPPAAPCFYFPAPTSSLVADDRREVGIAYEDAVFGLAASFVIDGSTTDATHTITLTADGANRHNGVAGTGVIVDALAGPNELVVSDANVTVEWLELRGLRAADNSALVRVLDGAATNVLLQNLLVHDFYEPAGGTNQAGIRFSGTAGKSVTIRNVMIWDGDQRGIEADEVGDSLTIENCSIDDMRDAAGSPRSGIYTNDTTGVVVRNTIATRSGTDFRVGGGSFAAASSHNVSQDASAPGLSPLIALASSLFVNPGVDLHLKAAAVAIDGGADLSASFRIDVDGGVRPAGPAWDRGADEFGATTAVKLQSFTATAADAAVALDWRTASELDNLGFHIYRSLAESGPWTRLTTTLIAGLGSSALGRAYSFRDTGLVNGTRYFYRLEDVDTRSKATAHGPVSAVPAAAGTAGADAGAGRAAARRRRGETPLPCPDWVAAAYTSATGSPSSARLACSRHGDPEAVSLGVVSRDARSATLELRTGGFYALHEASGRVRVFVPGFDVPSGAEAAALPVRRALVEALVGRGVRLGAARAREVQRFTGLEPAAAGQAEMRVDMDGTVRATRREDGRPVRGFAGDELARLLPSVFQGETKSAVVQISPLRFDPRSRTLTLARRVEVKLVFAGREPNESGRASRGRRRPPGKPRGELEPRTLARLYTTARGLHVVPFESLFAPRTRSLDVSELSLKRHGAPVAFAVEPPGPSFGPGSRLFFVADAAAASTAFSGEVAWELQRAADGVRMPLASAAPTGGPVQSAPARRASFETNRYYQPGLLEATDPWLWEALAGGAARVVPFALAGVDASDPQPAALDVELQGASESGQAVDHHIGVSLNGVPLGAARFAGKKPYRVSLSVPAALLREGANELQLTNVGDTGVSSLVFLDRFSVTFPGQAALTGGVLEAAWPAGGTAAVAGAPSSSVLVDLGGADAGGAVPRWLTGFEAAAGVLRFAAEAGHLYLAASPEALLAPRVTAVAASSLRSAANQADWLLVAPRAFLTAAEPLVARREAQGLRARAVALEEIADEFGDGEPSAEAIRAFVAFAYQSWARPSPRYVLLLGDASYDPRNFTGTAQPSPLPALWTKTSYLWTASDPLLGAVNGEDALPDLAVGRLPAQTAAQAQALVEKLVAWEDSGQGLAGPAALVADNPDAGGDFEANAREIADGYLAGRSRLLLLRELGAQARPAIRAALDEGLGYLDYVGHGGSAVWASENVWNSWDAASLLAQSRQPLLLTMNCLNGYFVAPSFDSLAESLVKAEGRGAIAAVSPSGLSLDGPAHQYHRALLAELTSGRHERLGDAILAAQQAYAQGGLMPELVAIYQLLGDPAMTIR